MYNVGKFFLLALVQGKIRYLLMSERSVAWASEADTMLTYMFDSPEVTLQTIKSQVSVMDPRLSEVVIQEEMGGC